MTCRRRRDPRPGDQGRPVPSRRDQHPRPLLLMRTALPSGRPVESPVRATGAPRRGDWSWCPDIMGLRPLFDDHCRPARRRARLGGACVEPWPGHRGARPSRSDCSPSGASTTAPARRSGRGRRCHRRGAGRRHRVLHGRHVRPQGGGHRALPPGGGVLRDDPGARALAGADDGRTTRTGGSAGGAARRWPSSARSTTGHRPATSRRSRPPA